MDKNFDKYDSSSIKNYNVSKSSSSFDTLGLLKIVFILLFLVMVFRSLSNVGTLSFTSFLQWLRDFHPILKDASYVDMTISASWGVFDFLKNFINLFMQVISVAVFLCKSLVNFISYIVGFVRFLFVF